MDDLEIKTGGYTFKATHVMFAMPLISALAGGIYYGYDVVNRFMAVEGKMKSVVATTSRIQALEQTIGDNDVANLSSQLSAISTSMTTILEQQRTLLDLRSKVERSSTVTDGLGNKLATYEMEIEDLWKAFDELVKNPIR